MKDTTDSIYRVFRNIVLKAKYVLFCFPVQYIYINRGSCLNYTYLLVLLSFFFFFFLKLSEETEAMDCIPGMHYNCFAQHDF